MEISIERLKHSEFDYHAPKSLEISNEDNPKKVLVIGSCQAEGWKFNKIDSNIELYDVVITNNLAKLENKSEEEIKKYDLQILQIPIRSLIHDSLFWNIKYDDLQAYEDAFIQIHQKLTLMVDEIIAYNKSSGLLTFFANFLTPQQNPMGRLLPKYDLRNIEYFIHKINESLEKILSKYSNVFVLDIDKLSSIYGKKFIQDDSIEIFSHGSVAPYLPINSARIEPSPSMTDHYDLRAVEFKSAVWSEVTAMWRTIRQKDQVKLVVVDLDDTLWNGVVGEMDNPDGLIAEGWPLGLVEALAYLKKRGVLLAIISKNDESRIRDIWPKIFSNKIALDDFAVIKINYEPKVLNMQDILDKVNLLPKSVIYIDDNPVERASMKSAFPEMRVLTRFHYYWRRILLWSPETQVQSLSKESLNRTEMIRAQISRDALKQEMSREDFLKSLQVRLNLFEISSSGDPKFARSLELINKTNQFNTTGKRWTLEEMNNHFSSGNCIYAFEVTDNFTSYGLVGVIVTRAKEICQMVMSCRVIGLDVEICAVGLVSDRLRLKFRGEDIFTSLVETPANKLCRDLWDRCGFIFKDGGYYLDKDSYIKNPIHISII